MASQKIAAIDRLIDDVRRTLLLLETVDELDPASWQRAWDRQPFLYARDRALHRMRGEGQLEG